MSSVDNRIVKMQFENAQFESGAKNTLNTLSRLKEALNFSGAGKSLDSAISNAGNANLSGLENSVDTVNNKFSILATAAAVALGNIATQAISTGAAMVKAFAIEPITQGFEEYELKMNSIQTMMMSTGEPLERVNEKLGELNTYADKTIYSFSDMTQNIGKFTNAGVSLDKSVAAIQGVANVAALSGASATDASHAMYNFGQALSSGAVRLQDWKSIEIANMATVEFKNELIKTALEMGTLVQEGDRYISTTTDLNGKVSDAFNATQMFNDSLSSQWMTTEVLTETLNRYADETTEIGKRAYKAATQVKTFSQLIDTTKEAIGTGWADTFEIVVGNFEEARDLWTSISDVIGNFVDKQSKARNEMLQSWKDLGGRSSAIQALSNVFSTLGQIMGAIGRAWEKAFPPMTGERLAAITKSILNFTERLKISESTVKAIETVFSGFFGILSIGVKALGLLAAPIPLLIEGFLKLLGVVTKLGTPMGSLINWISNTVLSFDNLQKAGELLRKMFEKLSEPMQKLKSIVSPILEDIANTFETFANKAMKSISQVFNSDWSVGDDFKGLSKVFDGIAKAFSEALDLIDNKTKGVREVIHNFFEEIQKIDFPGWDSVFGLDAKDGSLSNVFDSIGKEIQNGTKKVGVFISSGFNNAKDVGRTAITGVVTVIGALAQAISGTFEEIGPTISKSVRFIGDNLTEAIDYVTDKLSSFGNWIRDIFNGIIGLFSNENFGPNLESGGIFAIALGIKRILDSFSDIEKNAAKSIKEINKVLGSVKDTLEAYQKSLKADALIKIAAAVGILSAAILVLANLPSEDIIKASAAIAIMTATLSASAAILNKISGDTSSLKMAALGVELIGLSTSVLIMAKAMKSLSDLDETALGKGILGITAMVGELVAVAMIMSGIETANITKGVFSLLVFSQAIKTMAKATETLATLDTSQILQGLAAVAALEVGLGLFISKTELVKLKPSSGLAVMEIAAALIMMAGAVAIFGSMNIETLTQGLINVGMLLLEISIFANLVSGAKGFLGTAAGIAVLGVALLEFTAVVAILGAIPYEVLEQGLMGLAVALGELVLATLLMQGTIAGSAAILILAAALAVLTPTLIVLGAAWPVAATGILVVAAALAVLGVAALVLSPLSPVLLAITAAMLGLSAASVITGVGIAMIGAGLASLAAGILALSAVAGPSIDALIDVFGRLCSGILNLVVDLAPLLEEAFVALIEALAFAIVDTADVLIDAFVALGVSLCDAIVALAGPVSEAFVVLIVEALNAIAAHTQEFTEAAMDFITALILGINAKLEEAVQAFVELIIACINAIANTLRDQAGPLTEAIINLVSSIVEALLEVLAVIMETVPVVGEGMAEKLRGVKDRIRETLAPAEMKQIGADAGNALGEGLQSAETTTTQTAQQLGSNVFEKIKSSTEGTFDIGALRGTEFGEGLGSMADFANQNGINLTDSSLTGILSNMPKYGSTGTEYGMDFSSMLGAQSGNANNAGTQVTMQALAGLQSNQAQYPQEGTTDGQNFSTALDAQSSAANAAGTNLASAGASGANSQQGSFEAAGSNAGAGFANGIRSWVSSVADAARSMAAAARDAVAGLLNEHSPSKVTESQGDFFGEGFIIGILNKVKDAERAGKTFAQASVSYVSEAIEDALTDMENLDEYTPTITPVVDMTGVTDSAAIIQGLFDDRNFSLNAGVNANRVNLQNGSRFNELANSISSDNSDVVDQLKDLRGDIGKLAMAVTSMQIVLDSGVLVGETSAQMDNALQMRQIYAERGV